MPRLKALVESPTFEQAIIALIIVNAVTLGLETSRVAMDAAGPFLTTIDKLILTAFVFELLAKFAVYRLDFFRSPWRIFDLVVVGIALIPSAGAFSVLRALRIMRVLRLSASFRRCAA
jgi:voltage-gated sodium channel